MSWENIKGLLDWNRAYNWLAALGGGIIALLGDWDVPLEVLGLMMVADYVSGVFCAVKERKLSSQVGFDGILRKIMMFVVVLVAAQIDRLVGDGAVCRTAAIMFYVANEGVSLLENTGRLGLPWPKKLMDVLAQLKGEDPPD